MQDSAAGGDCEAASAQGPAAAAGLLTGTPKVEHAQAQARPGSARPIIPLLFAHGGCT